MHRWGLCLLSVTCYGHICYVSHPAACYLTPLSAHETHLMWKLLVGHRTVICFSSQALSCEPSMKRVLHSSLPQLIPLGCVDTSTASQISENLHSQGGLQVPVQKSWWTQPVCSFSDLTRPQSPRSLTESLSKDAVGGKARNMEKLFPSWTASQAAHHNCTTNYKLKKYQRIAEVPGLWLGRDLNLCLPISRGCLLVRAKIFHRD